MHLRGGLMELLYVLINNHTLWLNVIQQFILTCMLFPCYSHKPNAAPKIVLFLTTRCVSGGSYFIFVYLDFFNEVSDWLYVCKTIWICVFTQDYSQIIKFMFKFPFILMFLVRNYVSGFMPEMLNKVQRPRGRCPRQSSRLISEMY